jgi:uncharacterized protein YbjQ (UPF0145 family)
MRKGRHYDQQSVGHHRFRFRGRQDRQTRGRGARYHNTLQSIIGTFGASIQQMVGGNISLYTELCEQAPQEAFELMSRHSQELGANAIIGMRHDANEISDGVAEVLAYGTAVVIQTETAREPGKPA